MLVSHLTAQDKRPNPVHGFECFVIFQSHHVSSGESEGLINDSRESTT